MMSYAHVRVCACVHACACAHVWGAPSHQPHPHKPTHPPSGGDPRNQSKFNSTWTNWDISILFEDLKSVETSPPMGGCMVWWVGWWVGSGQNTKNLKIVWLNQDNSILFEDLWFVETPPPMGVGQWVGLGEMTNNWINLDLIEIIQFFSKILICRDTPTHGWVCGMVVWVNGWVSGSMGGVRSND